MLNIYRYTHRILDVTSSLASLLLERRTNLSRRNSKRMVLLILSSLRRRDERWNLRRRRVSGGPVDSNSLQSITSMLIDWVGDRQHYDPVQGRKGYHGSGCERFAPVP